MALLTKTSPHTHSGNNTGWIMQQVILACIPGVMALTYFFGFGTLVNILIASVSAIITEAAFLKIRKRPVAFTIQDYSAVVTAILLAIALPPYIPWWVIVLGVIFAIIFAKQLYGGLGFNPFNPAMAAYVMLLISLPIPMTQWAAPLIPHQTSTLGPIDALLNNLGFISAIDGHTMATPLDLIKQNKSLMMNQLWQQFPQFGTLGGTGWEWANIGFLLGGMYLLYRKIYTWHAPVSMLLTLALLAAFNYDDGSSASNGSALLHLFTGATMLGAWFIVTDPVTSATSNKGKLIYGSGIGLLTYIIRAWGNYPDGMAFAVLLMNFAAPLIDYYTQPRVYGHNGEKP